MSEQPSQSFLFADLAGFTALTEVHGDQEAVRVIDDYCNEVRTLLPAFDAHEVKSIGDAVLVRVSDAAAAVRLGLQITDEIGARHGFPTVRVGMHHGPAIERDGDYLGRAVNIAARIAALATGGDVLVTEDVVRAAGEMDDVGFVGRGRYPIRGIAEPMAVYHALRGAARKDARLAIDPVCGMVLELDRCAGLFRYLGSEYHFCSLGCIRRFAQHPERFVS